jgi:hypothetical protein
MVEAKCFGRRVSGAVLLLAALVGAAGSLHNHADLAGYGPNPARGHVHSNHNPLEKSSHWHSVVRERDHSCLACHLQRFTAEPSRLRAEPPGQTRQFVSHAAPFGVVAVFRLGDPTRGPPLFS